jgi:hypothetical protein
MPPNGSATSSPPDTLPEETLTSGQLSMFDQATSAATRSVTSLPASEAGASPCASPDGPMTDLFGPVPVPASPSAPPGRARQAMTSATCGPTGSGLSEMYDRQCYLANRLKQQLDGVGSTLFTLTWVRKATPLSLPYFQLAASARLTSGSDCGSWPTPMAGTPAQKGYNEAGNNDSSRKTVALASWPTPCGQHGPNGGPAQGTDRLPGAVAMASWATPAARDYKSESATDEFNEKRWGHPRGKPLSAEATLASWSTPRANKWGFPDAHGSQEAPLASGPTSNGSPAQTEKPGQLDPDFSRWLMGYSAEHLSCAPMAMPSSPKSRQSS